MGAVSAWPTTVQGPGTVALTASNITCPSPPGPCTSAWLVICRTAGGQPYGVDKEDINATVSIGLSSALDIDLRALASDRKAPANYTCTAELKVTMTSTRVTGVASTSFEVGAGLGSGGGRAGAPPHVDTREPERTPEGWYLRRCCGTRPGHACRGRLL